ncbi:MAG: hypothetical protein KGZ85_16685 [Ignavibacterium sp.]|nr:hypothetical protein [Ignavibacterium sp.]
MMTTYILAIIAGAAVVWYIVSGILIFDELRKRGEKVYFIFLNFMLPFYANKYKKITFEETGKVGKLFYHWLIAINTALVFAIAAIISNSL